MSLKPPIHKSVGYVCSQRFIVIVREVLVAVVAREMLVAVIASEVLVAVVADGVFMHHFAVLKAIFLDQWL